VISASRRTALPATLLIPAVLAGLASLAPLAYLIDVALDRGLVYVWDEIWRERTMRLVVRSLALAVTVTAMCLFIAVPAAWAVTRTTLRGRHIWRVVLALPLAIPSYLAAFAWVSWRPSLAGFWGAFLVLTIASYPYIFLPVTAAFSRLDPALDELAAIHHRGGVVRLILFSAQQTRSSIAAGALLVALYVLSDFGAVATMRFDAFTWVIYGAYRAGFNPSRAAVLALLLIILALMLIAAEALVRGRSVATMNPRAVNHPIRIRLGASEIVFQVALGLVVAVSLAFPIWRVLLWVTRYGSDQDIGDVGMALWGSLRYSFVAALVTVILALPIGLLAGKYRSRTASVIAGSTYVTHALPGVVVAISMVFIGVRFLPSWYLEAPLLVLAYVALFLPLAVGGIRAIVAQIPPTLDDVARSLGSTPLQTVRRVSLPLIVPGIAASSALVLLAAMKELPVTMLLRPTGTETLATRLWTQTTVSDYAAAGPYALALIIFVALPTALATIRS